MQSKIRDLTVVRRPIDKLIPNARNARTHNRAQIQKIADSIRQFGWINPIVVDAKGQILCGHGRYEAAKLLGETRVPTICVSDLTGTQKRAYGLADNRLAELAGWDRNLLAVELEELLALDFDVGAIGFETPEIDAIMNDGDERPDPADEPAPAPGLDGAVSRLGDLWKLGDHKLLCGDATSSKDFERLMDGDKAEMVITDPPYNVRIKDVTGLGRTKHREFAMASGEMTTAQFVAFLDTVMALIVANTGPGSIHFIFMDWRHLYELLTAGRQRYTELKNLCVWTKANGGMGTFYRSQHELVAVFKNGDDSHVNNFELGQHGRYRTNVWEYAGVNSFRAGRMADLAVHPTTKPVAMFVDAMKDCSRRGGIVIDCFAGSGTTILAAERTRRRARAMEIDPLYVDAAILRWQKWTGRDAILNGTDNKTYDEIRSERSPEAPRRTPAPRKRLR